MVTALKTSRLDSTSVHYLNYVVLFAKESGSTGDKGTNINIHFVIMCMVL
jgi:hypothetical protein